jgi:predicted ATPase
MIALAGEQRLYFWLAVGTCARAAALLEHGETEPAIAEIQQGLALLRTIGIRSSYSYYLGYLAAAYARSGRIADALAVVDEGLGLCATLLARCHEADLWRMKGELLAREREPDAAEAALRSALALARRQGARSYELRAATSLARQLGERGRRGEAHALLAEVHGWFTEGLESRDPCDARALLAELV